MGKPKVVILGSTGMLGAIMLDSFVKSGEYDIIASYRESTDSTGLTAKYPEVEFRVLDAETATVQEVDVAVAGAEWIVNAIGVIKPYIHDDNAAETERAILVNSHFPYLLAKAVEKTKAKVIQIATDCVYSGQKGNYVETDVQDALDVYGKTKSLGEVYSDNFYHIRCSIIGPELKGHVSLMDWFLGNPKGAELNGFTNHQWNGVTTLHFARLAQGIIKENLTVTHMQHIIPGNVITKANLLKSFAKEFNRGDITINEIEAPTVIDRTLATTDEGQNASLWKAAGYDAAPTIEQMVAELAQYGFGKKEQ